MGLTKKIGDATYIQDDKGDWYEVQAEPPQEAVTTKMLNGKLYHKDKSGDWFEGEEVKKKPASNDSAGSSDTGLSDTPNPEIPTVSLEPDEKSNPIDLAAQHNKLSNKTTTVEKKKDYDPLNTLSSQTESVTIPDEEARTQGVVLKDKLNKMGITDPEKLYEETKDFPTEAYDLKFNDGKGGVTQPYSKENLLKLRQENPVKYNTVINVAKNQFDIAKKTGSWNLANEYVHLGKSDNITQFADNVKRQKEIIQQVFDNKEDIQKANERLEKAQSSSITPLVKGFDEDYKSSPFASLISPDQYAGLKTLEVFKPEEYEQAVNLLKKGVQPEYETETGFDIRKGKPFKVTNETQNSIDARQGLETIGKKLLDIGRENTIKQGQAKLADLSQQFKTASPEEQAGIIQEAQKYKGAIDKVYEDAKTDDAKFPLSAQLKFDNQVKELTQEAGTNAFGYAASRFGKGFEATGNTLNDLRTAILGSDADKSKLYAQRLGESQREQSESYLPTSMQSDQPDYTLQFPKELKDKAKEILGNDNLSDETKQYQLQNLIKDNQGSIQSITNPEAGKHKNFFSKATLYGNAGMLGDIASLAAQSYGLGTAGASKLVSSAAPLFTTSYDTFLKQGIADGNPNPEGYAATHAFIMALAGTINPKLDIVKKALGGSKLAGQLAGVSEDTWNEVVNGNKSLLGKFQNAAGGVLKEGAKMAAVYGAGTSIANDLVDKELYDKNISSEEIFNHAVKETKNLLYNSAILLGVGAVKDLKSTPLQEKAKLWELGDNKEIAFDQIKDAVNAGEITPQQAEQRKEVVKNISKIIETVPTKRDGKTLTDKQRVEYFYNSLVKDKATKEAATAPPDKKEELEHTAKVADFDNNQITDPKTDKQLQSRKNAIEKELESKVDEEGKKIEIPEKDKKDLEAELESVNSAITAHDNAVKLSEKLKSNEKTEMPILGKENNSENEGTGKVSPNSNDLREMDETLSKIKIQDGNKKNPSENNESINPEETGNTKSEPVETGSAAEEGKVTGVKKAITDETRAANGMPKVEFPKMSSDTDALNEAKKRIDTGNVNPQEIVNRILTEKGNYKNEGEVMDMQYYAHQLERHNQELNKQLESAETPEQQAAVRQQKLQLSDLMDAQTEAAQTAGNQWGKTGNRMQPIINDAGQIFRQQKSDIKEAYGGELPPEVKIQLETITKERDEAIQAKEKMEAQLRQKMAAQGFEAVKKSAERQSKIKQSKEQLKIEADDLIEQLKKEIKGNDGETRQGLPITDKMVGLVGKLAVNYTKQGVKDLQALVDKIHTSLITHMAGLTKDDVRSMITQYKETDRLNKKADSIEDKVTPPSVKTVNGKPVPAPPVDLLKSPKEHEIFRRSTEWTKANQRVANAEFKMKVAKRKAFESKKNFYQRGLAWAARLTRLSILSGYNVLGKLASAATVGAAAKRPVEQGIGAIYSQAFKGIAQKAPIEGFLNARSEIKWYKEFFNPKKFVKNSWEILKSGTSDLGKRFGGAEYEHVPGLYIPTDLHQIIKDPVKRGTFEASFRNGMIWAEKNGLDINDPLVVNSIENASYKRAQYEIFQESNWLSRKFASYKSSLEKKGNLGATGKFVADFLIPVSTVPTNIVRRALTTSPLGLIRSSKDVIQAYRKGIENLNPDEADHVMRQLKQGTLGTALWLIGWYGANNFGGLYSKFNPNKKRNEGELASDEMAVNGKMIPKPTQHALPFEIIQLAATARHIYDHSTAKGESAPEAIYEAGMGSIGSMLEQIPVVETPVHLIEATGNPYEAEKLKADIKRRVEPQILRETGIISPEDKLSGGKKKKGLKHKRTAH